MERYQIEQNEKWREWIEKIPSLNFPEKWNVTIIPPYGGAMARFKVELNGKIASIYLDCHSALGFCDGPYWEVYPCYDDDTYRCEIHEVEDLMKAITYSLEEIKPKPEMVPWTDEELLGAKVKTNTGCLAVVTGINKDINIGDLILSRENFFKECTQLNGEKFEKEAK